MSWGARRAEARALDAAGGAGPGADVDSDPGVAALRRLQRECFRELAELRAREEELRGLLSEQGGRLGRLAGGPRISARLALGAVSAGGIGERGELATALHGLGFSGKVEQEAFGGRGSVGLHFVPEPAGAPRGVHRRGAASWGEGDLLGRPSLGGFEVEKVVLEGRPLGGAAPALTLRVCPFGATLGDAAPRLNPQAGLTRCGQGDGFRSAHAGGMAAAQFEAENLVLSAGMFGGARRRRGGSSGVETSAPPSTARDGAPVVAGWGSLWGGNAPGGRRGLAECLFGQAIYRLGQGAAAALTLAAPVGRGRRGGAVGGGGLERPLVAAAAVAQLSEEATASLGASLDVGGDGSLASLREWGLKLTSLDSRGLGWGVAFGGKPGGEQLGEAFLRLPLADNLTLLPGVLYVHKGASEFNSLACKTEWNF